MPDLPPTARVECEALIGSRDVHAAVDDDRRSLQRRRIVHRKDPSRHEARHVGTIDLLQWAISIAGVATIIAGPIRLRSHRTKAGAGAPQEAHAAVYGAHLQILD